MFIAGMIMETFVSLLGLWVAQSYYKQKNGLLAGVALASSAMILSWAIEDAKFLGMI